MASLELSSRTQCGDLLVRRLPRRAFSTSRNDKVRGQEPRGKCINKCVRDGSPLGFGLAGIFFGFFGERG